MAEVPLLSKSLYRAGKECAKRMWFDHYARELGEPLSDADRARMEEGSEVGRLAQGLYPGGIVAFRYGQSNQDAAETTAQLIAEGALTLYEATFVTQDRVVRCDILRKAADGGWIVEEVKASTLKDPKEMKRDGLFHDLAFQFSTLQRSGFDVREGGLVLLDKRYVWEGGDQELDRMFARIDITEDCNSLQPEIETEAIQLGSHLVSETPPIVEFNTHCKKCGYRDHCLVDVPRDDVMYLPHVTRKVVNRLRSEGFATIRDIPEGFLTDRRMERPRRVITTGESFVCDGLAEALGEIEFPAAFIDFESCQTAIPAYPGTGPYRQICFQWSSHRLDNSEAEPVHAEFLQRDASDPRVEFCRTLWEAVGDCRTLVIYSPFERERMKELANEDIPLAAELLAMLESSVDLERIVRERVCMESFKFRTSIKTVLPALVPSMSYDGMAIADGTAAMTGFRRMIAPGLHPDDVAKIYGDLLEYCKQDTLAMVEIYRALCKLTPHS